MKASVRNIIDSRSPDIETRLTAIRALRPKKKKRSWAAEVAEFVSLNLAFPRESTLIRPLRLPVFLR